jgi:hypothetical protein
MRWPLSPRLPRRRPGRWGSPIWVPRPPPAAVSGGEPIVLVEKGKIIDRNMRRERLTLDDLTEKARISEIESLDEVKWAVLETNGDISFIKQSSS